MQIYLKQLTEENFKDYESLTSCESGGGCYCAFWHQKISSIEEWDTRKQNNPLLNRQIVLDKVKTGYHVGVLAYNERNELLAWISIGPLIDFYWTWRRTIQTGENAKHIAAIMCFTIAPAFRGMGMQAKILRDLINYTKEKSWSSIEAYPFAPEVVAKNGHALLWPGMTKGYEDAGFKKISDHWLSQKDADRFIYQIDL